MPATLFVGLGSSHGDDRAGWLVADALESRLGEQVQVRRAAAPLDVLHWLEGVEQLALCDACRGIGTPGSWRRWQAPLAELPTGRTRHSHDLGLAAALELAGRLGTLPHSISIWGIEIHETEPGQAPSTAVERAIAAVADDVVRHLECGHA